MARRRAYSGAMNFRVPAAATRVGAARPRPPGAAAAGWRRRLLVAGLALLASACSRHVPDHTPRTGLLGGRVAAIADGDSFTLITDDGRRIGVRIGGIDAPEKGQPHADQARDNLGRLLARGALEIEPLKTDPYGRQVARVRAHGEDVALSQIDAGLAWHFVRYAADQAPDERERYARAQREARQAGRGLWADPDPIAPWLYRQRKRTEGDGSGRPR